MSPVFFLHLTVLPCQKVVTESSFLCVHNIVLSYPRKTEQAIQNCRRAIELQPNLPGVHYNLALALKDKGLLEQAEECYNQELKLQPNHIFSLNNLAAIKRHQGHTEESIALFRKALQVSSLDDCFFDNAGVLLALRCLQSEMDF